MIKRTYFAPQPITDLDIKKKTLINTIPFIFTSRYIYKNYFKQFYIDYRNHASKIQNVVLELIDLERLTLNPIIESKINSLKIELTNLKKS